MPWCQSQVFRKSKGFTPVTVASAFGGIAGRTFMLRAVRARRMVLIHKAPAQLGEIIRLGPN